jgi:regulator of protease activity HflC (stomatin/prohibitin superfamily)
MAPIFLPAPAPAEARALGDTLIGALTLTRWGGPGGIREALESRFGIVLSRSWALAFVRTASLPVGCALALVGWSLSGIVVLKSDERGVYERFGAPVAVLGPGLHTVLPWPLGIVRRLEFGVVHETSIALAGDPGNRLAGAGPLLEADAEAPPDADRLWNESHASEASYLIPGGSGSVNSFQLVDLDLRLVYRVGLGDRSAMDALYHLAEPESVLRAAAGRLLVRYFSTRTLVGILGEDPARLGHALRDELQAALDASGSGLELLAVVVEAVHPPPGAAGAYHAVQAAEIIAATAVATQQRRAAATLGEAQQHATETLDQAQAGAAEAVAAATVDRTQFLADLSGARTGDVMRLERRLGSIERGFAGGKLVIVDRRLGTQGGTVLDLRNLAAPTMPSDVPDP